VDPLPDPVARLCTVLAGIEGVEGLRWLTRAGLLEMAHALVAAIGRARS
jgi:hypothetical protein